MEFWRVEVVRKESFSWHRLLRKKKNRRRNFLFWWRLASEMSRHGSKAQKKAASAIAAKLKDKYACDIALDAKIGACLHIPHHMGIVITSRAHIGEHCIIRQNTTLGGTVSMRDDEVMTIGNNVDLGANSCLVGPITIGDNVVIGAMSFVNKDIPADTIFVNPRIRDMRPVTESFQRMHIPRIIDRK